MNNPKIDKIFQSSNRLLIIIGFWPLIYHDLKSPWVYLARLHNWFMYSCITLSTLGEILYPILTEVDFIEATENVSDILGSSMAVFKFSIILWSQRNLYSLLKTAHIVRSKMVVKETDPELQSLETKSHKEATRVTIIMLVLIGGTISTYIVGLIYELLVKETSYLVPYNAAYPFEWRQSIVYQIVLMVQLIASVNFICVFCGVPSLLAALVIFACCQFRTLQLGLKQLTDIKNIEKNSHVNYLKRCIAHQQEIYKFCIQLGSIFGPCIFIQFVLSGVTLSLVAFQVTLEEIDMDKKITFIQFFCLIVGTLFVYCWYGENLSTVSESISYASYGTHWYHMTKEFKTLIRQMIIRSQKPVYLSACGFINATLESYSAVLQASLSYFTLLRTLGGTDDA